MRFTNLVLTALLLTAVTTGTSRAELSPATDAASIEYFGSDTPSELQLMQTLNETRPLGLSESVLRQHARSALRSKTLMEDSYGHVGAEMAVVIGDHDSVSFNARYPSHTTNTTDFESTSLVAAAGGAHFVGSGEVTGGSAPIVAASSGSSVAASAIAANNNPVIPGNVTPQGNGSQSVPLPPTVTLFASALFGLPAIRRFGIIRQ